MRYYDSDSDDSMAVQIDAAMQSDPDERIVAAVPQQWVAAETPRELTEDLLPIRGHAAVTPPLTLAECTPAALLPWALLKDHPELNFPAVATQRRRTRGKRFPDGEIGLLLARLQHDSTVSLLPWKATWQRRRTAYHEYVLDVCTVLGKPRKLVVAETAQKWNNAEPQAREAWAFLRAIREKLYNLAAVNGGAVMSRTRIALPPGVQPPLAEAALPHSADAAGEPAFGKGIGLMRTFNTSWHEEELELPLIMQSCNSLSNKVMQLRSLPFLQDKFRAYENAVREHAQRHSMHSWACCLEISLKSKDIGRVHLHDYIGPSLDSVGMDNHKRIVDFKESDRSWDGMSAWTSVTSARGNAQSKKMKAVVSGMYYITAEKVGMLFCQSSRVPFEDMHISMSCTFSTMSHILALLSIDKREK